MIILSSLQVFWSSESASQEEVCSSKMLVRVIIFYSLLNYTSLIILFIECLLDCVHPIFFVILVSDTWIEWFSQFVYLSVVRHKLDSVGLQEYILESCVSQISDQSI